MQEALTWKINKFQLLYFFLLIPFFPLQSIKLLAQYDQGWITIYNVLALFRCGIAVIAAGVFVIYKKRTNLLTKGIIAFEAAIFIACCVNGSITFQFSITNCLSCIGFACICQHLNEKRDTAFLNASVAFFGVLAILGSLIIFIFPNGFNHVPQKQFAIYLLGSKNSNFYYYMVYIFLKTIQCKVLKKSIPGYLICLNIIFIISSIICDSMNGLLMLMLILVFLIHSKYNLPFRHLFRPKTVLLFVCLIAIMIPLLASGKFDCFFSLLGRESNFSMRTFIWESAIEMVKQNPVWGNGKDGDLFYYGRQTHAHDIYLDYASKYGVLALGIFIGMLIVIAERMERSSDR